MNLKDEKKERNSKYDSLKSLFDVVDDDKKTFAYDTLDEYLYFQEQINRLRTLPLIRISEKNPERQEVTPAGKLIKDYSQVLDAKRTTLLRLLTKAESSAVDELQKKLEEFE